VSDTIKFSFEGTPEQLIRMLSGLALPLTASAPGKDSALTYNYAPQPVSAQQPPPPVPRLTPANPAEAVSDQEPGPLTPPGGDFGTVPSHQLPSLIVPNDPVYGRQDGSSNLAPTEYPQNQGVPADFDFASLSLEEGAWEEFTAFVAKWIVNFDGPVDEDGKPTLAQPDRLTLLKDLSHSRWAIYILRWCAHYKSLQGALHAALWDDDTGADFNFIDRVSANIVQVAHAAFPDIAGFHDYSTKWSRDLQGESA